MEKGVIRSENIFWSSQSPPNLGAVTITGLEESVSEVIVNNIAQAFRYDTIHKVLNFLLHTIVKLTLDCSSTYYLKA